MLFSTAALAYQAILYNKNMSEYGIYEAALIDASKESDENIYDTFSPSSKKSCFYPSLMDDNSLNVFKTKYFTLISGNEE